MNAHLRVLNDSGIGKFSLYLEALRADGTLPPPFDLLTDPAFSEECTSDVSLEQRTFADSYEFGDYIVNALDPMNRRKIAYDYRIWTWLALFYFDQVCPAKNGKRTVLEDSVYLLAQTFNHRRYYRHLVRTPWLAVKDNQEQAKVLLQTKAGGKRSDIFEQLAARQTIFGNQTIIGGAYKLYYDVAAQSPKRGASGKGAGSPRRLVSFVQQIDRTYDLRACTTDQFIDLLPPEFNRFRLRA